MGIEDDMYITANLCAFYGTKHSGSITTIETCYITWLLFFMCSFLFLANKRVGFVVIFQIRLAEERNLPSVSSSRVFYSSKFIFYL